MDRQFRLTDWEGYDNRVKRWADKHFKNIHD